MKHLFWEITKNTIKIGCLKFVISQIVRIALLELDTQYHREFSFDGGKNSKCSHDTTRENYHFYSVDLDTLHENDTNFTRIF